MKITTVNVNGIRAAYRKGMGQWLSDTAPDVLLCQETRAPEEIIVELIGENYQVFPHECQIKGRAGVAVAVRHGIEVGQVRAGVVANEEPVDTGRWLEVGLPEYGLTVVSAYLHSGKADDEAKMSAKYAHLDKVSERLGAMTGEFVVGGDFNIVHTEADITNWKSNHNKTSGVLDREISYLDQWFGNGFVDVQRHLDPDSQGPYTWWSQRGKAFDNNVGWRIDYHMATPALAERARTYTIDRATSYDTRWSDHAALTVIYDEQ
ncbi:exodeoxyribonuclease III [Arcanobacterium canis]